MTDDTLLLFDGDWDGSPADGLTDVAVAAAAYELAMLAGTSGGRAVTVAPLPAGLADAIGRAAAAHVRRADLAGVVPAVREPGRTSATGRSARPGQSLAAWAGWCVAAGLGIALVARQAAPPPAGDPTAAVTAATIPAERLRARLLAEDPAAIAVAWTAGKDPAVAGLPAGAALGDVVWSQRRQQGYMRFHGLAANDPATEQYQLWIFDAQRDEAHPVDGGVFDVATTDGEVCVPIDARLPIGRPTLFAITVERPGGVVVSSRERLPLLAKVP